jgi:ATP-dependent DNA helicase
MPGYVEPDEAHYDAVRAEIQRTMTLKEEEWKARKANEAAEKRRRAALQRRNKKKSRVVTPAEREAKAKALDQLMRQSQAFSEFLTDRSGGTLGGIGSGLSGKAPGEHEVEIAEQPKCLTGGTMRDYQLEGLTWLMKLCEQGLSGILADEMGLGMSGVRSVETRHN